VLEKENTLCCLWR